MQLTVNGKKISKAQRQIILQKEYERENTQRQLEKQIISKQMKSCCDLATYSIELIDIETPSGFEKEVFRRHMLENVVTQRDYLKYPYSMRDVKSFSTVPIHLLCPNALTKLDIERLESNNSTNNNASGKIAAVGGFTTIKTVLEDWNVFNISNLSKSQSIVIYQNKQTLKTQAGRPFDLRIKLERNTILKESWLPYEPLMSSVKKCLFAKKVSLMSDPKGGLLFYCPRRDEYSSNGAMSRTLFRRTFTMDKKESIENSENGVQVFVPRLPNSGIKFYGFAHPPSWSKYLESNSFYWKHINENLWNIVMKNTKKCPSNGSPDKNIEEKSLSVANPQPQHDLKEFEDYSKQLQTLRMGINKAVEQMESSHNFLDNSANFFPDDSFINRDSSNQIQDKFMRNIADSFQDFQNGENKAKNSKKQYSNTGTLNLAGSISSLDQLKPEKVTSQSLSLDGVKRGNNGGGWIGELREDEADEDMWLAYERQLHPKYR